MKQHYGHWLFKFLPEHTVGITLPWGVYFRSRTPRDSLIRHETIHVMQIKGNGVIKFYSIYFKDYLLNMIKYRNMDIAYRKIPFEIEAYGRQNDRRIKIKR